MRRRATGAAASWLLLIVVSQFLCSATLGATLPPWANKIKHVVVLMEENRSFDHMFGWYPGVNGLTGKEYNPVSTYQQNSKRVYVDKLAPMIAPCDPDHGTNATTYKIFGAAAASKGYFSNASMVGFVEWENLNGNARTDYCRVMSMLTPHDLPVLSTLASEFAIMDHFFASHAGPTWPNRLFMLSATSAGLTSTGPWYHDQVGQLFPQETFFDQLTKAGMTWRNYFNDTPWELFLGAIAHNPENLASMEQFFVDAREGTLPNYSWINPRSGINVTLGLGSNDQHPDHDIALGEQYYKDIYEAIRASPLWEETLLVITYDEHGGFFDHVPTPLNVPPPGDGEKSYPEPGILFNRLGVRLPTILISPWIPKGLIISEPPEAQKPAKNSEYELTSIMATTRKLFGMTSTPPLTKRDAWSATFEQALSLTSARKDCPMHLPPAPTPSHNFAPEKEALLPLNDLQNHILQVHAQLAAAPEGELVDIRHIQRQGQVSDWLQRYFRRHVTHTVQWKESKSNQSDASYSVECRPFASSGWLTASWNVKKGKSFDTISSRHLSTLCMDYRKPSSSSRGNILVKGQFESPQAGYLIGVSNCYPSSNPDTNRDPSQQWLWGSDATVRPAADKSLCLTTGLLENKHDLHLQVCNGGVEQHWAWHGPAPGESDGGWIFFGDDTNAVGIVSN